MIDNVIFYQNVKNNVIFTTKNFSKGLYFANGY